jgi:hypothetical protein
VGPSKGENADLMSDAILMGRVGIPMDKKGYPAR